MVVDLEHFSHNLTNVYMFRTDAQQSTGYVTGQPGTQSDGRLCNRIVTCALHQQGVTFTYPCVTRPMDAFVEYLVAAFPKDAKRTRSAVIHLQFGERIISCLKNPLCIEDRSFCNLIK